MDWLSAVVSMAIGLCSGCVTGLIGASGVLIVVPALVTALGLSIHTAIGTSLAVDVIASMVVAFIYYRRGNIDLRYAFWIALGAVLGAQAGSVLAAYTPEFELEGGFSVFLIISGLGLWREDVRRRLRLFSAPSMADEKGDVKAELRAKSVVASFVVGFTIGVVSGVFGAGGGVMFLMVLIFVLKYPLHKAIGTSTFIMMITALSGAIGYGFNGNVSILTALVVGVGSVIGGRVGAVYANEAPEDKLAKIVGAMFVLLGVMMLVEQIL